jgi:tetrapyrrole methylase family protein/MazG family protein
MTATPRLVVVGLGPGDPDTGDSWPEVAVVLQHLGLPGERVEQVSFDEALAALRADELAAVFIPVPAAARSFAAAGAELARLASLVATLRERCPWDREQTHSSLVRHLLEEAYEAIEAIDGLSDPPTPAQAAHFEEEIGDLLCQVYFHATLAAETGSFDLEGVARTLREKLVARHPHVFGDRVARDAGMVVANWERGKLGEKGRTSLMDGIPPAMPALAAAVKVERKAAGAGLGFAETGDPAGVRAHLEELLELLAPAAVDAGDAGEVGEVVDAGGAGEFGEAAAGAEPAGEEQLGELLLEVARMAAAAGLDAEGALRRATSRFKARFVAAEGAAAEQGALLHDLSPGERLRLWHRC